MGAKNIENSYSRNVKLNSASVTHRAVKLVCAVRGVFGYGGSNGVTVNLCDVTGSDHV